jgi:ADP-L-glycero-D-manno-heptose 6-epimerase
VNACRALEGKPPQDLAGLISAGTIEYIPFPEALQGKYQSFTQADISALRNAGFADDFSSVEAAIGRYVPWMQQDQG